MQVNEAHALAWQHEPGRCTVLYLAAAGAPSPRMQDTHCHPHPAAPALSSLLPQSGVVLPADLGEREVCASGMSSAMSWRATHLVPGCVQRGGRVGVSYG